MKKIEQLSPLFELEPLELRLRNIAKVIEEKRKNLESKPDGKLRISIRGKAPQYYFRHKCGNTNGVYLSKPNAALIHILAQTDYDQKVLNALEKEQRLLQALLQFYKTRNPEKLFSKLSPARQQLVNPVTLSAGEFFEKWRPEHFAENPYKDKPAFQTAAGIFVRSKSEVLIADALYRHKIPFIYELPLMIGEHQIYPDFTCIHPRTHQTIIWEHLGMLDNPDYAAAFCAKIGGYIDAGYIPGKSLIYTLETSDAPLIPQTIKKSIKTFFEFPA